MTNSPFLRYHIEGPHRRPGLFARFLRAIAMLRGVG